MKMQFKLWVISGLFLTLFNPDLAYSQAGLTSGEKIETVRVQTGNGFDTGVKGGSALEQLENMSGAKVNVPRTNPPAAIPSSSRSNSAAANAAAFNNMVAGALIQGLFNSLFSSSSSNAQANLEAQRAAEIAAQQAAEQQRINEERAQAEYDEMMKSYKLLDGSKGMTIKSLTRTELGFKTLESTTEITSVATRKERDVPTTAPVIDLLGPAKPTAFFGDIMPEADLQTLIDPENNPNIVDLRETNKYVDEKVEKETPGIVDLLRKYESVGNGEPIITKPDCVNLKKKLIGFTDQRLKFQKTVDLAQSELDVWETANRNALMNAAKDGIEYFTGQLFEGLNKRGAAAERLQLILDKNAKQMAKEGVNIAEIQAKIDRCRLLSSAGKKAELANNMNDWQTFIKDGMSAMISQLTSSNDELKGIFENPETAKYFQTEAPELNTLLDISKIAASNKVFGKWVAKKIPMIALIEISIKQLYNGTDYFMSLNRIMQAHKINGGVMETARYIQKNIDDTSMALKDCN